MLRAWKSENCEKLKNYNLASAVTVSEESGAISGNQWLPEMPTEKTELN